MWFVPPQCCNISSQLSVIECYISLAELPQKRPQTQWPVKLQAFISQSFTGERTRVRLWAGLIFLEAAILRLQTDTLFLCFQIAVYIWWVICACIFLSHSLFSYTDMSHTGLEPLRGHYCTVIIVDLLYPRGTDSRTSCGQQNQECSSLLYKTV